MERLWFKNSKGIRLAGILHKPTLSWKTVFITSHEYLGDKSHNGKLKRAGDIFSALGFGFFRFDYSGCGESEQVPITVENHIDDLRSAINLMKSKGFTKIIILGASLGGLIALRNYDPCIKTMILLAPISSADVALLQSEQDLNEFHLNGKIIRKDRLGINREISLEFLDQILALDSKKILSGIKCPILIIHGDKDEIVSLDHSKKAIKLLPNAVLKVLPGADHYFVGKTYDLVKHMVSWLLRDL